MNLDSPANPIDIAYLITAVLFILGLKYLSSPASARFGNRIAAVGMVIAVVATLLNQFTNVAPENKVVYFPLIIVGAVIGGLIGVFSARAVKMTAMPQMVALFNGAGGGAAALVATSDFIGQLANVEHAKLVEASVLANQRGDVHWFVMANADQTIPIVLSVIIGALSFTGSIIAFMKLQELLTGRPITYPGQQFVNGLIGLIVVGGAFLVVVGGASVTLLGLSPTEAFAITSIAALILGVLFVLPIGGADMPVVISLLNAFTGLAVSLTGFALGNNVLIISGALVGASGTLLTILMGKAMNRPIGNVLFGAFGAVADAGSQGPAGADVNIRATTADDVAMMLAYAQQVIIVPGYGMAVAQAQHVVKELADRLEERGVTVKYAIHPVAGRMPGHMNVLLAEADVPYPALYDMEDINPEFARTDVALVIGANDVTNPAARTDKASPIYGMPILDVDKAQNVVVLKRSMRSGFAGIHNPLYEDPKCLMLFGDAKESVQKLVSAVKTA